MPSEAQWQNAWQTDPHFLKGVEAWNAGDPFAAHEHWESLWLQTPGPERRILQGMIQVAASAVKARRGNRRGALSLFGKGLGNLESSRGAPPSVLSWRTGLQELHRRVLQGLALQELATAYPPFR